MTDAPRPDGIYVVTNEARQKRPVIPGARRAVRVRSVWQRLGGTATDLWLSDHWVVGSSVVRSGFEIVGEATPAQAMLARAGRL